MVYCFMSGVKSSIRPCLRVPRGVGLLGAALLNQQLWCWGRDIVSSRGNLLLDYGAERIAAPSASEAGSLYVLRPSRSLNMVLRGYGVFCGRRGWGGVFLKRFEFRPLRTASDTYPAGAFEPNQLPPLSRPRTSRDWRVACRLTAAVCRECADYERFVLARFGCSYRSAVLRRWRELGKLTLSPQASVDAWNQIADRLEATL
jgi:hypothetical protein